MPPKKPQPLSTYEQGLLRSYLDNPDLLSLEDQAEARAILGSSRLAVPSAGELARTIQAAPGSSDGPVPEASGRHREYSLSGGPDASMRAPTTWERAKSIPWNAAYDVGEGLKGPLKITLGAVGLDPKRWIDQRMKDAGVNQRWQEQTAGLSREQISAGLREGAIDQVVVGGPGEVMEAGAPIARTASRGARRLLGDILDKPGPATAPYVRDRKGGLVVSVRAPTGKAAVDRPPGLLTVGLDEAMLHHPGTAKKPSMAEKMATIVRPSGVLTEREAAMPTPEVLDRFTESLSENLRFLMKQMGPHAERSANWYKGSRRIADEIAKAWGFTPDQGAGIVSVLSPQKQWPMNVELGRRVAEHSAMFTKADQVFTADMYNRHVIIRRKSVASSVADKIRDKTITESRGRQLIRAENKNLVAQKSLIGLPWSELPIHDRGYMVRAHDELVNDQNFLLYTPEGTAYDVARNIGKHGEPGDMTSLVWNSNNEVVKALGIAADPSPENISYWLGARHKVRSFFNNISSPEYGRRAGERGSSTIDTHEVAAGHMAPLGGKSSYVLKSMSSPTSKVTGVMGTNPLYQEAVSRSVEGSPYLANQGQSIGWEGIQGLFSPAQKRDVGIQKQVGAIWAEYRSGRLSKERALDAVLNVAGGFTPPGWANVKPR